MGSPFKRLTADVGNVTGLMRLKRLDKIRLGIKKKSAKSGREYPSATDEQGNPIDYFIVPDSIKPIVGDKPKVLKAMFASNDPEEVYEERLALYGAGSGLKCHGDGTRALRRQETGEWKEMKCPCPFLKTDANPTGQCTAVGSLKVMLPEVSMWGYFEIKTHSIYARAGILSSLKQLQDMVGRIAFVPLKLERAPQDIVHEGKSKTHYIVGFTGDLSLPQIIEMRTKPELMVLPAHYQLEAPEDRNPADDPVDAVVMGPGDDEEIEAGELAEMADEERDELATVQQKLREKQGGSAGPGGQEPVRPPLSAAEPKRESNGAAAISKENWKAMIEQWREDPYLNKILNQWIKENTVSDVYNLKANGQQLLIAYLKDEGMKIGIKVPL